MKVVRFLSGVLAAGFWLFCAVPGHAQFELRGGNIVGDSFDPSIDVPMLQHFKDKGATAVRLFYFNHDAATDNESQYRQWLQDTVYPGLSQLVPLLADDLGLHVLISIHSAPGGRVSMPGPVDRALIPGEETEWMRSLLVEAWSRIAGEFNGMGSKVSYQIYSEPAPPSDKSAWIDLQKRIIDAIRDADSTPEDLQPVVYYMTEFGTPSLVKSVNLSARRGRMGITASLYSPFDYTHQGTVSAKNDKQFKYPGCGVVGGKKPKKKSNKYKACTAGGIENSLKQFYRFASRNNLSKLAAEFSVSRFAPSSEKYLTDLLRILKKRKIGWMYYTFNERHDSPWRLDCADHSGAACIPVPNSSPSSRQKVIEKALNPLNALRR